MIGGKPYIYAYIHAYIHIYKVSNDWKEAVWRASLELFDLVYMHTCIHT